jgi:hypothetical protein
LDDENIAASIVKLTESAAKSAVSKEGLKEFGCV